MQDISKKDVMDIMSAVVRERGTGFTIDCRPDPNSPKEVRSNAPYQIMRRLGYMQRDDLPEE